MISLSMTFSDLWPQCQGHDIFWSRILWKWRVLKTKLLLHNRNMWNGTMFVDLDWPLNASSLLSASAELLVKTHFDSPDRNVTTTLSELPSKSPALPCAIFPPNLVKIGWVVFFGFCVIQLTNKQTTKRKHNFLSRRNLLHSSIS